MIDAALAERLALLLAGGAGDLSAQPDWFGARVERAAERIVEVTGLRPAGTLPSPEWLDRGGWAAANLASTGSLLNPLLDRVGENLGMLGGPARAGVSSVHLRLGGARRAARRCRAPCARPYELALLDPAVPPRLLFVGPNIDAVALGMDVERDELADWVIFHEVTHAVQFGGVPWLREHISALLRDLLGELELKVDAGTIAKMPTADDLKALAASVRDGGLLAVVGPGKRELLDRVQAIMALVEGHAEWTMDAAAEEVIPSLAKLREALDARRRDRPPALRVLDRLLGLEMKMRQYQEGRAFCDAVVAAAGVAAMHGAWRSPEDAPTIAGAPGPVPVAGTAGAAGGLTLRAAGGPLHVDGLIAHLGPRAVPGMEEVDGTTYRRVLRLPGGNGVAAVRLSARGARGTLWLERDADRAAARRRAARPARARRARRRGRRRAGARSRARAARGGGARRPGAGHAGRRGAGDPRGPGPADLRRRGADRRRRASPRGSAARSRRPNGTLTHAFPSPAALADAPDELLRMPRSRQRTVRHPRHRARGGRSRRPPRRGPRGRCAPPCWRSPASAVDRGVRRHARRSATPMRSRRRTSACCARRRRWGCRPIPAGWRAHAERWRPFRSFGAQRLWAFRPL